MSSEDDLKFTRTISQCSDLNEYKRRTYADLSQQFKELYPSVARAFELIPQMYNRLTLVDGQKHKDALAKIRNDHHHLSGFTGRNIRRYLPADNPNVPRRVRTSRPKNNTTGVAEQLDPSNNEQGTGASEGTNAPPNKNSVIDFEFHLDWDYLLNYMNELRNLRSTLEVWFNGELDRSTGKVIAVYAGRKEDRNHISEEDQSVE
jgi:hypothetical protein